MPVTDRLEIADSNGLILKPACWSYRKEPTMLCTNAANDAWLTHPLPQEVLTRLIIQSDRTIVNNAGKGLDRSADAATGGDLMSADL